MIWLAEGALIHVGSKTRQDKTCSFHVDGEWWGGDLCPHEDALVIRVNVACREFNMIFMDSRSLVDILFKSTLNEMWIANLRFEHTNTSLKGFKGGRLTLLGVIVLPITIGSKPFEMLDFIVIKENSPYQMIFGRPFMRISHSIMSTHYMALKYRVNRVVSVVKATRK